MAMFDKDLSADFEELDKVITEVEQHDEDIRRQMIALGEGLGKLAKRAAIHARTEDFTIGEISQDDEIYGHLGVGENGEFYLAYRSTFEDIMEANLPPNEVFYTVSYPTSWDVRWLRAVATKANITVLLERIGDAARNVLAQREEVAKQVRGVFDAPPEGIAKSLTEAAEKLSYPRVVRAWGQAQKEVVLDPPGAITQACTLVETTLKHLMRSVDQELPRDQSVTSLYKAYAKDRNLHPEQGNNDDAEIRGMLNALLRVVQNIVQNIGAMRTKAGDAHGKSQEQRYGGFEEARLAVNAAGTVCTYLMRCHAKKSANGTRPA